MILMFDQIYLRIKSDGTLLNRCIFVYSRKKQYLNEFEKLISKKSKKYFENILDF